ncbi:MAG: hypothetical protein ACLTI0_09975 [Phocaeicola dorei]|nr:hypothetical protein [Bacteroides uniformis]MBV4229522.1 hypothetical protein [Bacteroides uniformis]
MAALLLGCHPSHKDDLTTAEEAMAAYNDFFQSLKGRRSAGTDEIISLTKEWRKLDAAVSFALSSDTANNRHAHANGNHIALGDSIALQMAHLINSQERSFADYLAVIRGLNDVEMDSMSQKLAGSVHLFYRKASAIPVYKGSGKEVIRMYNKLLEGNLAKGLRTKEDAIDFLRQEDVAFRSFLLHLPSLSSGNTPLDGITRNTGKVIRGIIGLAGKEQPVFGKSEVVILLTMRNNRRLLQNAEACVDGLSRLHITDNGQAAAYLWMILQPWISFDSFAYALMDEEQLRTMEKLAERMPQTLAKLKGIDFPLETEELPTILMKTFILGYE